MGLSVVPSSKSRLLTCLIGNKALLCTQSRRIGLHLSARGKFHGFSRVAAGTWVTFSSYGRGSHEQLLFFQRRQDSSLIKMDTPGV